jgi:hypothetical protein
VFTAAVVTLNVREVVPAVIVTLAGTVADGVLLSRFTTAPAVGAGAVMVTVPVDVAPPVSDVGFSVTDDKVSGFTVTGADVVPL